MYGPNSRVDAKTNQDLYLYAVWYEEWYYIEYDNNGGNGYIAITTQFADRPVKIREQTPTRTGYKFMGWATTKEATVPEYQPGDMVTVKETTTLYAVWKQPTYMITYDANGGTGAPEPQTKNHGQNIVLSSIVPVREGYTFRGWTFDKNLDDCYQPGEVYKNDSDLTLYAVWKSNINNTYTVTFKDWDGKELAKQTVEDGQAAVAPANPTRSGYKFTGWDKAFNYVTSDLIVTAQYEADTSTSKNNNTQNKSTKIYSISTNPWNELIMNPVKESNYTRTSYTVTVTNTGNMYTGQLTISLSGSGASSFELSKTAMSSLAVGKNSTFKITPKLRLAAGTYTATVTISGKNISATKINISLTVTKKETSSTISTGNNTYQNTNTSTTTPVITINIQPPETIIVTKGSITESITVNASVTNGKAVKYQWAVSKTGKNPPLGTQIKGETSKTFKIPTNLNTGTYYYFCVITADGAKEQRTNITKVIVK